MVLKLSGVLVFIFVGVASYIYGQSGSDVVGNWYSVLPPVFAVTVALITNNVFISLIGAVLLGAFLIKMPSGEFVTGVLDSLYKFFSIPILELTDTFNLQVIGFVVCVLALISVVIVSGGLKAVIRYISVYANGRKSTNFVTFVLGILMFIDDYANTMLVGSSMRGVYDANKISREKLAFIVDSTAAPVAGLVFISTWVGYEVGLLGQVSSDLTLGVGGFSMFFDAVIFRFYCIFTLAFVLVNIFLDKDFGPMASAEASTTQVPVNKEIQSDKNAVPSVLIALVPMVFLVLYVFIGLWIDGGGGKVISEQSVLSLLSFSDWKDVVSASENNILILFHASLYGLILAMILGVSISKVHVRNIFKGALRGVKKSMLPVSILVLAWSIKTVCKELETGPFLVSILADSISPVWFPIILFVIAGLTAFTTGTSWGTMAILIPFAIPLASALDGGAYGLVTILSVATILDGAIFGDHCSPISDTTIMSSISSGCDHMSHVKTQAPYSVVIAFVALIGYYLSSMVNFVIISCFRNCFNISFT